MKLFFLCLLSTLIMIGIQVGVTSYEWMRDLYPLLGYGIPIGRGLMGITEDD